jgi:uncharacterized protein (TIGR03435 family)
VKHLLLLAVLQGALAAPSIEGTWQGTLAIPDRNLAIRLAFKIARNGNAYEGRFYNLENGRQFSLGAITLQGNAVKIVIPGNGMTYEGKIDVDGNSIAGTLTQGTNPNPLSLKRATAETAWELPPPPAALQGPPTGTKLAFEVASVKQNVSGESRVSMRTQPGGRLIVTNVLVRNLIATAFAMADPQPLIRSRILGGPDWIDSERYDINAKATIEFKPSPDGPAPELLLMIRSLVEERFKLKTHLETRELPVYELVLARADRRLGPEMRKPAADCDAAIATGIRPPRQPGEPPPCGLMGGPSRTIAGGATMQQLAANLSNREERLVIDKTGLAGRFAFTLAWTPDRMPTADPPPGIPPIDPNGPSLFTALQEQLGLKLEPAKGPVEVLVIDRVEHPTSD